LINITQPRIASELVLADPSPNHPFKKKNKKNKKTRHAYTGKVRHVGVTNFDAPALEAALASGLRIISNTVQYSILDQRPVGALTDACLQHNVTLLCYGTLLGGFLTDRWLGEKAPDPRAFTSASEEKVRSRSWSWSWGCSVLDPNNRRRPHRPPLHSTFVLLCMYVFQYYQMLRAWGSWEQFQELLAELKAVARKHRSSIAHVALRWVLDRPAVGSVMVGTRLGYVEHLQENKQVLALQLSNADRENIERAAGLGKDLREVLGGVGVEYKRAVADVPERYVSAAELKLQQEAEDRQRGKG
jgi:diketogulonate reductase-like aldo/keto reductase